jgi:hypothetical protein
VDDRKTNKNNDNMLVRLADVGICKGYQVNIIVIINVGLPKTTMTSICVVP